MPKFEVDIPNSSDIEGSWENVGTFDTLEEAVAFCQENFGADEQGNINLITEMEYEEDLEDDN